MLAVIGEPCAADRQPSVVLILCFSELRNCSPLGRRFKCLPHLAEHYWR